MLYSLSVILAGALWGVLSVFVSGTVDAGFSTLQCVCLRLSLSAVVLFIIILLINKKLLKIRLKDFWLFMLMGLGLCGSSLFYFMAMEEVGSSGVPAMLLDTSPVFVMLLSVLLFKEKVNIKKITALILTLIGVVFTTGAIGGAGTVTIKAVIVGISAGISYAVYSIVNKFAVEKYDTLTITFYSFLFASVVVIPFSGIFGKLSLIVNIKTAGYISGLVIIGTILPFLLYSLGLSRLNASKVSMLATSELVVASLIGVIFFSEKFTVLKIFGSLCIFFAIIVLNLKSKTPENS